MLPKKTKSEKKIKYPIPPFQTAGMKKIQKKKQVKPAEPVTRRHVSERGFISAVSNGGNEENDKKKRTKTESGSF